MTEKDLNEASMTGAAIIGFDISVPPNVSNRIESAGVPVHIHKLIYKFQEDLEDLVHDMKKKEELSRGRGKALEIVGEAHVLQIFNVKVDGAKKGSPKKQMKIAGSRVHDGEIDAHLKYRLMREDECLVEDLEVLQLKKFKKDVTKVEKGMECGICLTGFKNGIEI